MAGANSLQLYRALPLNDSENTQLFTFKLSLRNLEEFRGRHIKSSPVYYQGQEWYLTCKFSGGKDAEFIGVYVYWGSPHEGERCKADFRIIMRNIADPTKSLVTEGSQVEFSAPRSPGWGKREFAPLNEILSSGGGFVQEPEGIIIVELAMKSCSTVLEQMVDCTQLLRQQRDQQFPSYFTPNFKLAGLEFYLSLYPLGDRPDAEGNVSIYLHRFVGNETEQSVLMGCRIRYRFFFGSNFCPSSSKTFEFSFKNEQGYGRFKAFEPIQSNGILKMRGPVPVGVEIVSATPFIQPEIRLMTRGYYHTDNFVFEESSFRDHRGNLWKMNVDPTSPMLHLHLRLSDDEDQHPGRGLRTIVRTDTTKFVQWRAFVLSRSDRKKTLPVTGCPLSAYFSRGLPQKNYNMTTSIPILKAKSLDGDYSSKEEPSLLVRIEMLNIQDIPGILYDYPTLDFERFQLYHTREGLKRCLKQNESLMEEVASLRSKVLELKVSRDQEGIDPQQMNDGVSTRLSSSFQHTQSPQHMYGQPQAMTQIKEQPASLQLQLRNPQHPTPRQRPTRPSSLHSQSPVPIVVNNPRPAARNGRGPPPKPPPRAYSPISNDSNMKRFAFSKMSPLPATAATPSQTGSGPSTPVSLGLPSNMSALAAIAASKDDTAFKRFSFTGINVTPSLISDQMNSGDDHTPGQTQGPEINVTRPLNQVGLKSEVVRRPRSYIGPSMGSVYGPTPYGARQTSVGSDSAFKRFSFTGVTTTPSLISTEADTEHSFSREEGYVNGTPDEIPPEQLNGTVDHEGPSYDLPHNQTHSSIPVQPYPVYAENPEDKLNRKNRNHHEYATLEPPSMPEKKVDGVYEHVPRKTPTEDKELLLEFKEGARIVPKVEGGDGVDSALLEDAKVSSSFLETSL